MTSIGRVSVEYTGPVRVMGIINVSPESFYKNSIKIGVQEISKTAIEMQESGADIIDIGAMSTAPYLETVIPLEEEIRRLKFAIEAVKSSCNLPISIDTPRSVVAREVIKYGVDAINDITGLKYDKNMGYLIYKSQLPVIIGAFDGNQSSTLGKISDTIKILRHSLIIANRSKIDENNIIIDPSIGFFRQEGKNPFYTKIRDIPWYIRDIETISKLNKLKVFSRPICISVSRKSFIGNLLNLKVEDRLIPSVVSELVAVLNGANLIRTHNVKETIQALIMLELLH
ncbi:MAG: dihydropteroate synthase [Nitrososphaeraceae archaeon]